MKRITLLITLLVFCLTGYSQLNPMGSVYYHNRYLFNPAMAGTSEGLELNAGYKAQWTAIEGAPAMASMTAAYGFDSRRVGLGLNLFNDRAGVLQRTSVKLTYAYHLPLNGESSYLDFGFSGGLLNESVDFNKVIGDASDQSLYNFNQRSLYFDGDFGVAYRSDKLTIQGALPNLKRFLNRDVVRKVADRSLYMASASYLITTREGSALESIEPMVAYRGVENYKDIIDVGANLRFMDNKLLFSGMYHSTNSATIGLGTIYKKQLTILGQYTTNTSDLGSYSNGEFEIALKYNFR